MLTNPHFLMSVARKNLHIGKSKAYSILTTDRIVRRYVTLEPNADNRSFGASEHIVGTMESMGSHIRAGSLDLIICNGVFGWGLDEKGNCEKAFAAAHAALKPGGQLMVGWNDVPRRCPFPLESISSLSRFRKLEFPLYRSHRYLTDTVYRHVFDFYVK